MAIVEKANLKDAGSIQRLVNHFADKGEMLHRPLSEIYENIRGYFVCRSEAGEVLGCAALQPLWSDMGEIRAVAVWEENQRQEIGRALVGACLNEAKELGLPSVFLLTYRPEVFGRFGFERVDRMTLPRKVWGECYKCPKYPDCEEVAMIRKLD